MESTLLHPTIFGRAPALPRRRALRSADTHSLVQAAVLGNADPTTRIDSANAQPVGTPLLLASRAALAHQTLARWAPQRRPLDTAQPRPRERRPVRCPLP